MTLKALTERVNAIVDPELKTEARAHLLDLAVFHAAERRKLAKSGAARPDGSFPIRNEQDLRNAIRALGRAKNPDAAKRHIIARARSLGLTSILPDSWKSTNLSEPTVVELARAMTKDGRRSFRKNGGKYRHGFIPLNHAAKVAKAKGSPIAMKRQNRLFGEGGGSAKVRLQGVGGKGSVTGRAGQVTGAKLAKAPAKQAVGGTRSNTATDSTTSAARKPWDEIDDSRKTIRNGKRYVVTDFKGKKQLVPWVGQQGEKDKPANVNIIRSVTTQTANQMTATQLRKLLKTKGKAQGRLARAPLNAALRKKVAK